MNKIFFITTLFLISLYSQAQFLHSIELNNGISVSKVTAYNRNFEIDPNSSKDELYFSGISSAINLKYWNHKYWNLSSQLSYMETGQKTSQEVYENLTNIKIRSYSVFYFNLLSFNTMIEIKYPNKYIIPSIKFGPRIDFTFIDISKFDNLNKINYGLSLGGGVNHQFNGHFNLHADFIYNWIAKDVVSESTTVLSHSVLKTNPISISRNMSMMIGFGYKF
ncbi:MAG: hypothetical protein ACOYO1_11620 [Bacteroidales bacterium]